MPVSPAVAVRDLSFTYAGARTPALDHVSLELPHGCRCLLLGRNGAGKSTLLHVLAGRHLVPPGTVRVLGRPAFHDTSLSDEVVFLGGRFPFRVDITVGEVLERTPGQDPARTARLLAVLGVAPTWHMHRVSDGQRRRVQILLGLLRPPAVLLLDEITTDLDLLARIDLLGLVREQSEAGGAVVYATHILDGLDGWATHLAFLEAGRLVLLRRPEELPRLAALRAAGAAAPLLALVERWLRHGVDDGDAPPPEHTLG